MGVVQLFVESATRSTGGLEEQRLLHQRSSLGSDTSHVPQRRSSSESIHEPHTTQRTSGAPSD